jgi:hypothetical protein
MTNQVRTCRSFDGAVGVHAITLALWACWPPQVLGHSHGDELKALSVDELKAVYLACDDAAAGGRLTSSEIMKCSVVYEQLKQRAFDGDFAKLHAWSRALPGFKQRPRPAPDR